MKKPLVIVDITAVLFRMYFGGMSRFTENGVQIGGVWGICTTLKKINEQMKPKYFAAVFDAGQKTFRNDLDPNYKANRGDPPDDLIPQFGMAYELCTKLGIHCFMQAGVEADDLMASLALLAWKQNHPVHMVTVDKDLNQLVRDAPTYIHRVNFFKKQVFNEEFVKSSMGVHPKDCIDFMALVGDSIDNIPGVKGIGPKKASVLIERYGNLEGVYMHLDTLEHEKGWKSAAIKIREQRENAFLSRKLVRLKVDIDLSSQVTDIQQDLRWIGGGGERYLQQLGLERYLPYLCPI